MSEPLGKREGILNNLGKLFGINRQDRKLVDQTYGEAIQNGTATFIPGTGENGVYGTLRTQQTDSSGNVTPIDVHISDSDNAAYLAGLQGQADSKKK